MSMTLLQSLMSSANILIPWTKAANDFFAHRPTLYKVALVANHLFRAALMAALMFTMPCSLPITASICFAGSLFYRLTVENNCAYKFALPSYGGALAFFSAQTAWVHIVSGAMFTSISLCALSIAALLPSIAYVTYILLTVDYDVDAKIKPR